MGLRPTVWVPQEAASHMEAGAQVGDGDILSGSTRPVGGTETEESWMVMEPQDLR